MAIKLNQQVLKQTADLHNLSTWELDQITRQQYGVSAAGLKEILSTAHRLNMGGELSLTEAQTFAKNVFGDVPAHRVQELVYVSNQSNAGPSRSRSFLQNLMKDKPDMAHRLGEVYQMAGIYGQNTIANEVNEHFDAKALREAEQDRMTGKDRLQPSSTYEPSEINSLAHRDEVRMGIEAALDEQGAVTKMSHNDRMGVIIDAKYGDTDLGDIFRNRAAEERGESNTIRSDLGADIDRAFDSTIADAIDEHEGTAT